MPSASLPASWLFADPCHRRPCSPDSFGGYASALYALKYPQHVNQLVLVSPVGIPEKPKESMEAMKQAPWWLRGLISIVRWVWTTGTTPQALVRGLGPLGPRTISGYVTRRFTDNVDKDSLSSYLYHISALPGSTEHALQEILLPGAFAKKPLINRLHDMRVPTVFMYGDKGVSTALHLPSVRRVSGCSRALTALPCFGWGPQIG